MHEANQIISFLMTSNDKKYYINILLRFVPQFLSCSFETKMVTAFKTYSNEFKKTPKHSIEHTENNLKITKTIPKKKTKPN